MPSFDVVPRGAVDSARGVPCLAGGTARRRMYHFPFALFHVVCAPYILLFYIVGRVVVLLPPVGLRYMVFYCFVGPVGPFGSFLREYPTCREAFLPSPPSAFPSCCRLGVLHVAWFCQPNGGVRFRGLDACHP